MAGGNFMHRVISYVVNELVVNGLANRYPRFHFLRLFLHFVSCFAICLFCLGQFFSNVVCVWICFVLWPLGMYKFLIGSFSWSKIASCLLLFSPWCTMWCTMAFWHWEDLLFQEHFFLHFYYLLFIYFVLCLIDTLAGFVEMLIKDSFWAP